MIISISQPTYLPWLGYFDLIARADIFVFLDNVQFERQSWQSRNRLKGANNQPFWLSVPTVAHPLNTPISAVKIQHSNNVWVKKHQGSIRAALGGAPFFEEMRATIDPLLNAKPTNLAELNISIITHVSSLLGFSTRFMRASEMDVTGTKADLILSILNKLHATHYRCNAGSRAYMEDQRSLFSSANITWEYQAWEHPIYEQRFGKMVSHLAFPDALSYLGIKRIAHEFQAQNTHASL